MFKKHKHKFAIAALTDLLSQPLWMSQHHFQQLVPQLISGIHESTPCAMRMARAEMRIDGGVARIPIVGLIVPRENWMTRAGYATSIETIIRNQNIALGDSAVSKIAYMLDSPGGIALMVDEAATVLFRGRGTKPMLGLVTGMCCSACYYLASQLDGIAALPSTTTGSVGAIYHHMDISGFFAEFGIKIEHVQHGQHKSDASPFKPLDDQGRATLQQWVTSSGDLFDQAVARGRGISVDQVRENYGQGQWYLAKEALEHGLIDHVADAQFSIDELFEEVAMSTDTNKDQGKAADTDSAENNSEDRLAKLETGFTSLETKLDALLELTSDEEVELSDSEKIAALEAELAEMKNANKANDGDQDETSADSEMNARLDRIEASIKHLGDSSADGSSGVDGEGSPEQSWAGLFKRKASAN